MPAEPVAFAATAPRASEKPSRAAVATQGSRGSVLEHHNGVARDGLYIDRAFTRKRAASLRRDTTFSASMSGPTYAQPLYFADAKASRDLIVVGTEQNEVTAFDPSSGRIVWRRVLGRPVPRSKLPCGNVDPLGITGTPAIDAETRSVYLDAMTADAGAPKHFIFALSLDDGSTRPGWPVDLDKAVRTNGADFHSAVQNQRTALLVWNENVYVPYGGHFGDCGNYRGFIVGVPLRNPSAPFAWASGGVGGGIWAPSALVSDGNWLYVTTGNTKGAREWSGGEAVLRLPWNLSFGGGESDFFTPANWRGLDRDDEDLGGAGPALVTVRGAPSELIVALGKDGKAYLLDRERLGGESRALREQTISSQAIITAPASYTAGGAAYVAFTGNARGCAAAVEDGLVALRVTPGSPPSLSVAWCAAPAGKGSPIVTATARGTELIVWRVTAERDDKLWGYDAQTGAVVFGGGGSAERMRSVRRFQAPIVANGRLFVAGDDELYAFVPARD